MLGILFIYYIGKHFYDLAIRFEQNKWLFAILGVVSYYVGGIIGGLILGFADVIFGLNIDWDNDLLMSLLAIPFGIGTAYLFYKILKIKWEKLVVVADGINDIGRNEIDT